MQPRIHAAHAHTPERTQTGFTLIELLVVIAILALLIALIVPISGRAIDRARLTAEKSNARQFAAALLSYAQNNQGRYPTATREGWALSNDDISWYRGSTWKTLVEDYGANEGIGGCSVWLRKKVGIPGKNAGDGRNVNLGWNVWVGRNQAYQLRSGPAQSDPVYGLINQWHQTPPDSSSTMFTCYHYLSTMGWGSEVPHVGGMRVQGGKGLHEPSGLTVARLDGSVIHAPFSRLRRAKHPGLNVWFYYLPDRP